MSRAIHRTWCLFVTCALIASSMAHAGAPLKAGDRVVIYGDSITEQKQYSRFLQQYVYCRYPGLDVRFYNAGWSGDRAPGALQRLERDVLALNPTVVTLFFGMNDGRYKPLEDATVNDYRQSMEGIIKTLKARDVRVIVFSPGCVDADRKANLKSADYNRTLAALGEVGRELAKQHGCEFVDVHGPMLAFQTDAKAKQPDFTMIPDGVHPDPKGHIVVARTMLSAFTEPMPPLGEVDVAAGKVVSGNVEIVSRSDTQWVLKATTTTPYWIEPGSTAVAEACGMTAYALPRLVVKGLPAGTYQVVVDGQPATQATAEQLAAGIAVSSTAGKRLHDLVATKETSFHQAWRTVQLGMAGMPGTAKIVAGLHAADDGYHDNLHALAAQAVTLTISIERLSSGPNLALRKPYVASDPNPYNWGIGALTDGSWDANNKTCFATGDAPQFPKSVTIDLGEPATLASVRLGVPPFGSTRTVRVSISENDAAYADVGKVEFAQKEAAQQQIAFPAARARYVRLTYVDQHPQEVSYNGNFAFTTEVEVYGPEQ